MENIYQYQLWILLGSFFVMALSTGCASTGAAASGPDGERHAMRGMASWYGENLHGRTTASGEVFDMHEMTAAHRTLPFGAIVRVRTVETKKSVVVRINDRGPFADGRVIDLSYAAARDLEMVRDGVVEVELEVLQW